MPTSHSKNKSLTAMAAILGASVGMNVATADARGIEAGSAENAAGGMGEPKPLAVAQEINVRRDAFPSGRPANRLPSNQMKYRDPSAVQHKIQPQAPSLSTGAQSPKAGARQPSRVAKMPAPPAPFVPIPYPNTAGGSVKKRTVAPTKSLRIKRTR